MGLGPGWAALTVARVTQMMCDPEQSGPPWAAVSSCTEGVSRAEMLLGFPPEGLSGNKSPLCAWGRPGH